MKASLVTLVTIAALCVLSPSLSAQNKAAKTTDPSGTWRWEYELGGATMKDSLRLSLSKDNKLVGYFKGREDKPIEIKEAKM